MRKIIIAGNWKMNKDSVEAVDLAKELVNMTKEISGIEVLICPSFVSLSDISSVLVSSNIKLGAQNMYYEDDGAFTGQISSTMLKSVGCEYVIIGHSERRAYFGDTNEIVNKKLKKALASGLTPILCVGETLEEREQSETYNIIEKQLMIGLDNLQHEIIQEKKEIVVAYEPIWAIGTGKVATPEQAQDVHSFIRTRLGDIFSAEVASRITIQYGGSVKPNNIKDLISQPDIDGALIGGASLKADSFVDILKLVKN